MVAALKGATTKMEAVLEQSKSVQQDLCKSLEVVSTGTWRHPPAFCVAGVALMALGWLWWRAWVGISRR